jgi:hypothetical protein
MLMIYLKREKELEIGNNLIYKLKCDHLNIKINFQNYKY